jgi:peroxisomal 3,2-trans-enoyl-CoA isomerase
MFPLVLGTSKASEMLILNQRLSAKEAVALGFAAQIYRHESEIWERLQSIDRLPLGSIIANKKLMRAPLIEGLMKANEAELEELAVRMQSEEAIEALINFAASKKSKL